MRSNSIPVIFLSHAQFFCLHTAAWTGAAPTEADNFYRSGKLMMEKATLSK